jgi:DNA-binding response OmpR family regulator
MAARPKVLIVEDDHDLRRLYAVGLSQRGFEVLLAANGADALDRAAEIRPDIVLLDMIMPVMDGWELVERLNPEGRESTLPVVVISGQERPREIRHESIVDWISKPASIETLSATLSEHLHSAGRNATA